MSYTHFLVIRRHYLEASWLPWWSVKHGCRTWVFNSDRPGQSEL